MNRRRIENAQDAQDYSAKRENQAGTGSAKSKPPRAELGPASKPDEQTTGGQGSSAYGGTFRKAEESQILGASDAVSETETEANGPEAPNVSEANGTDEEVAEVSGWGGTLNAFQVESSGTILRIARSRSRQKIREKNAKSGIQIATQQEIGPKQIRARKVKLTLCPYCNYEFEVLKRHLWQCKVRKANGDI